MRKGAQLLTGTSPNPYSQRTRRSAPPAKQLTCVRHGDADATCHRGRGEHGLMGFDHAGSLQIAILESSPNVCSLREAYKKMAPQNAGVSKELEPNELRAWRDRRGLTQQALADAVGTTASVISLLEKGERQLTAKWLRRLSKALETSPGYLLDLSPDELPIDLLDTWARIPQPKREQALAILATFADGPGG